MRDIAGAQESNPNVLSDDIAPIISLPQLQWQKKIAMDVFHRLGRFQGQSVL
jgi:hypothetical protein